MFSPIYVTSLKVGDEWDALISVSTEFLMISGGII